MGLLSHAPADDYRDNDAVAMEAPLDPFRNRPDLRLLMLALALPAEPLARRPRASPGGLPRPHSITAPHAGVRQRVRRTPLRCVIRLQTRSQTRGTGSPCGSQAPEIPGKSDPERHSDEIRK